MNRKFKKGNANLHCYKHMSLNLINLKVVHPKFVILYFTFMSFQSCITLFYVFFIIIFFVLVILLMSTTIFCLANLFSNCQTPRKHKTNQFDLCVIFFKVKEYTQTAVNRSLFHWQLENSISLTVNQSFRPVLWEE